MVKLNIKLLSNVVFEVDVSYVNPSCAVLPHTDRPTVGVQLSIGKGSGAARGLCAGLEG